jgi:hypothetical protein
MQASTAAEKFFWPVMHQLLQKDFLASQSAPGRQPKMIQQHPA